MKNTKLFSRHHRRRCGRHHCHRLVVVAVVVIVAVVVVVVAVTIAPPPPPICPKAYAKTDRLWKQGHWSVTNLCKKTFSPPPPPPKKKTWVFASLNRAQWSARSEPCSIAMNSRSFLCKTHSDRNIKTIKYSVLYLKVNIINFNDCNFYFIPGANSVRFTGPTRNVRGEMFCCLLLTSLHFD